MSWLNDNQRVTNPVMNVLQQINTEALHCRDTLNALLVHQARCLTNQAGDPTHTESQRHGQDGTQIRTDARTQVDNVLSRLATVRQLVDQCFVEMSHMLGP